MQTATPEPEMTPQTPKLEQADSCRLLAACFYPPDQKLLLHADIMYNLEGLLKRACPEAAPLVPPPEAPLADAVALSVAYTRLFLGPPTVLAPPYASFYLDKNSSVMGPSTVKLIQLYRAAGLRLDDDFKEMPDHIAVILEFLYYLMFKENMADLARAPEETARLEKIRLDMLDNYLFPWVPRFCRLIATADEHPFYNALGRCLDAFVQYGLMKKGQVSRP